MTTLGLSLLAALGVASTAGFLIPWAQWFGRTQRHGPRSAMRLALTFDDGPSDPWTDRILDVLHAEDAPATFFVVGANATRKPETVQRIAAEGHVIGNHTYSHSAMGSLTNRLFAEVRDTDHTILEIAGVTPCLVRPPFGHKTPWFLRSVRRAGHTTVLWDVVAGDWTHRAPSALARRVVDRAKPGSIVLLHDGDGIRNTVDRHTTVEALPGIIRGLRARGFELVTVAELLSTPAYMEAA